MEQNKILHKDIKHFSKTAFSAPILPLNKKLVLQNIYFPWISSIFPAKENNYPL